MHLHRLSVVAVALGLTVATAALAGDWTQWRGPNYDGSTEASNLPATFSKTQNVKWSVDMPGPSAATPIIVGDRVFVSSATDPKSGKLLAMCLDRKTGKQLWSHQVGSGYQFQNRSNFSSPSPVSDGKIVIFFYGNGDLAGFSLEGKRLWSRNLQEDYGDFTFQWTFSSSPTLYDGGLFLQILQRDQPVKGRGKDGQESFVLKMDPMTGKTLIKHVRKAPAQMESLESFATPIPFEGAGRKEIVILGGDIVTGHDPATMKELWRWGTWNPGHRQQWWRLVPSICIGKNVGVICAPKGEPAYAVKMGLTGETAFDAGLAWKSDAKVVSSDVPTPLYYDGAFFVLSDKRKNLSRVNESTGKIEWTTDMPGRYLWRASPTAGDGKIYCINHHGDVVVLNPADGKILHQTHIGHDDDGKDDRGNRALIAIAHDQLFIRTVGKLWCIGQ